MGVKKEKGHSKHFPAGIFYSGSVHLNGNLNGWVRTDMNEC